MNKIRIAISPLSWVNEVILEFGAQQTAERCLHEAQIAKYEGVEMSRIFPKDSASLNLLLNQHQLSLASGWHNGFLSERGVAEELASVDPFARLLRNAGANVMVYGECGYMTENALDIPLASRISLSAHDFSAYGQRLTQFARELNQRYNLRLSYHHHLMMVAETLDDIRQLMASTGDEVGLLLDTGHAYAAGFDYQHLITEFSHRINHIHLKDVRKDILKQVREDELSFNDAIRAGMFTVPGDGVVEFNSLFNFLKNSDYQGWIVVEAEQDPSIEPPFETVTRAYQFVNQLLTPVLNS